MGIAKATVLIIDDEVQIRHFLRTTLVSHDYDVEEAGTAREGTKKLSVRPPDLLILDLGLPDGDGLDILKQLREWNKLPVIVLSARGFEQSKVDALEAGADDYLTKPFGAAELLARMRVALRHSRQGVASPTDLFKSNGLVVDREKRVITVDGNEVRLTPTEYKLLTTLVQHAGKVVTHGQLLREVWGKRTGEQGHYLRIYMQHVRQKLGDDALSPRFIITETGVGYRLKESP